MGKHSPALFELIRDKGVSQKSIPVASQTRPGGPSAAAAPAADAPVAEESSVIPVLPRVEPKPRVVLAVPRPEPAVERPGPEPAPAMVFPTVERLKRLQITPTTISIGAGAALLLALIVWATAFKLGEAKAERAARKELEIAGVTDPLKGDRPPLNPTLLSEPGSQSGPPAAKRTSPPPSPIPQNTQAQNPPARPAPATPTRAVLPSGPLTDTREIGLNYCIAASRLDKPAADRAAGFLRENGVSAVPVLEGAGSSSNNGGLWKVVVLSGISRDELRASAPVKKQVEAELTRLGEVYRKDPKGRIDFGQFFWEKKTD